MECAINGNTAKLARAQQHAAQGRFAQAELLLREVIDTEPAQRQAMEQLVIICLQTQRPDEAVELLRQLVSSNPAETLYYNRLAGLLERLGRDEEAIACYRRLLTTQPGLNTSRYNFARLLKRVGRDDEALREYEQCLRGGIENPEDVHTNVSVIHSGRHRHDAARQSLQAALSSNPAYIPALFNLALLEEEHGDWPAAKSRFKRILKLEPRHAGALAHLANGERITSPAAPAIRNIKRALRGKGLADSDKEELLYALGKTHDDCRQFDRAFDYFRQANELSRKRVGGYDAAGQHALVDRLIDNCDAAWISSIEPVSQQPLIFICGMFRSGSTLLEQVLAGHPDLAGGGEIDFFQRQLSPFPARILDAQPAELRQIGQGYISYLAEHFAADSRIINKRPDNFLCLGLLHALYPRAVFLNTQRQPLDNCLSLYLQPLEQAQAYANDLLDTAHYYRQYQRLMQHWQQPLGGSLIDVEYEQLVRSPQETIGRVLEFLQLDWHESCLDFHRAKNRVRTASVHQVRQPLYSHASGRWQNYEQQLTPLRDYFDQAPKPVPE